MLAEIVLARVPPAVATALAAAGEDAIESLLVEMVEAGQAAWPQLSLRAPMFVAYLADRLSDGDDLESLRTILAPDLFLACACAVGERAALAELERNYIERLDGPLHELDKGRGLTAEIKQRVREKLLASEGDTLPGIVGYRGRGALKSWIRIVAIRMGYRLLSKTKREVELKDIHLGDATGDMELEYFKSKYKADFSAAFAEAMHALEPRQRTLMRMSVIDGLSCSQLGAMYSVNKSTVSRWLSEARELLAERTKEILKQRLNLSPSEVDSVIRMVRSRIDMSVHALLMTRAPS